MQLFCCFCIDSSRFKRSGNLEVQKISESVRIWYKKEKKNLGFVENNKDSEERKLTESKKM